VVNQKAPPAYSIKKTKKMKTVILSFFLALSLGLTAQTSDDVFVYYTVDEMTDKTYYFPSKKMLCLDEVNDIGFSITLFVEAESPSSICVSDINLVTAGFGCVENVEVIFLFEDGSKAKAASWNKFNCDGDCYLKPSKEVKASLSSKRISKIRVTNTYNYKTYTCDVSEDMKDYFIKLLGAVKNNDIHQYVK
jgi:hypothetical protein